MALETTTIQVRKRTAERLGALKLPGLTYDDVINLALDRIPPDELKKLYEAWQRESLSILKGNSRVSVGKRSK